MTCESDAEPPPSLPPGPPSSDEGDPLVDVPAILAAAAAAIQHAPAPAVRAVSCASDTSDEDFDEEDPSCRRAEPANHIEQPAVILPVAIPPVVPQLPLPPPIPDDPPFILADPKPLHPNGFPFLCYIESCKQSFAAAGPFALHLRKCHMPWLHIPLDIIRNYGLVPCPVCRSPYTSAAWVKKHKCTLAPAVPAIAPVAPAAAAAAVPPLANPQYFNANALFFATIAPDSPKLDHVHGQAIDSLPAASFYPVDKCRALLLSRRRPP